MRSWEHRQDRMQSNPQVSQIITQPVFTHFLLQLWPAAPTVVFLCNKTFLPTFQLCLLSVCEYAKLMISDWSFRLVHWNNTTHPSCLHKSLPVVLFSSFFYFSPQSHPPCVFVHPLTINCGQNDNKGKEMKEGGRHRMQELCMYAWKKLFLGRCFCCICPARFYIIWIQDASECQWITERASGLRIYPMIPVESLFEHWCVQFERCTNGISIK